MIYGGPCDWPLVYSDCSETEVNELFQRLGAVSEQVKQAAIDYLWTWTGRQFGLCEVTVEVCAQGCCGGSTGPHGWSPLPGLKACSAKRCDCGADPTFLRLPGPINSVVAVSINGETIDTDGLSVVNGSFVVAPFNWPQNTDHGVATITYEKGLEVPPGGQIAAGLLAVEMARSLCEDDNCQLPSRVTSVSRQGIEISMVDTFEGLDKGKTGIWLVDSWVMSVQKARRPGKVYSLDTPSPGRIRIRS